MLDHVALQTSHPLAPPTWMPAWPSRGIGYRLDMTRPRRHTASAAFTRQGGSFSRHMTPAKRSEGDQDTGVSDTPVSGKRKLRPYSAPAELQMFSGQVAPLSPFATHLLTIADTDEEKTNPKSSLWMSASGQRHRKGPNDTTPFHTMQKITCGAFFTRNTDHRLTNFGIPPVNTPMWRTDSKGRS